MIICLLAERNASKDIINCVQLVRLRLELLQPLWLLAEQWPVVLLRNVI